MRLFFFIYLWGSLLQKSLHPHHPCIIIGLIKEIIGPVSTAIWVRIEIYSVAKYSHL
jgi:hypothetical protein